MTIRIGTKISKLDPADKYKLLDLADVDGWEAAKKVLDDATSANTSAVSTINGKLDDYVSAISLDDNNNLVISHPDGAQHKIALATSSPELTQMQQQIATVEQGLRDKGVDVDSLKTQYGALSHRLDTISSTFSYFGSAQPNYGSDIKYNYFITMRGQSLPTFTLTMPDLDLLSGTMFHLYNENDTTALTVTPKAGETIASASTFQLPTNTYALLVKSGTNWTIEARRQLQSHSISITGDEIAKAIDNGTAPNTGSLKSLADGWWVVPNANTGLSGRPNGSSGDGVYFKQTISGTQAQPRVVIAWYMGQDSKLEDSVWFSYKLSDSFTPWFKADPGSADIANINNNIDELKKGNAKLIAEFDKLNTAAGNLYAPTKSLFDTAVNALIDAKLSTYKPGDHSGDQHQVVLPRFYAEFGSSFPTEIKDQPSSTTGTLVLNRIPTTRERIFVTVENENGEADKVTGISVDGGLPGVWQPRDLVLGGKKYRVFYSAGGYTDSRVTIKVNFGQG